MCALVYSTVIRVQRVLRYIILHITLQYMCIILSDKAECHVELKKKKLQLSVTHNNTTDAQQDHEDPPRQAHSVRETASICSHFPLHTSGVTTSGAPQCGFKTAARENE